MGDNVHTPNPPGLLPVKGDLEIITRGEENSILVGFETLTSGLDLLTLYQLSYEAMMGACRGNSGGVDSYITGTSGFLEDPSSLFYELTLYLLVL